MENDHHGASRMVDALSKLEMAIRPQSVPSWLDSDTNHAPKITALGPRRATVEYIDATPTGSSGSNCVTNSSSCCTGARTHSTPTVSAVAGSHPQMRRNDTFGTAGPSATSVRPRAPILPQKETSHEGGDFLAKETELAMPKRSRHRARHQIGSTKSRRVKQSLMESLRSLEFFDKTNRSRELSAKSSVMRTLADPEGNVHFVNIDDIADNESLPAPDEPDAAVDVASASASANASAIAAAPSKARGGSAYSLAETKASAKAQSSREVSSTAVFRIPELPRGQSLVVNILSTWGDPFYVGLMGIEVFDHTGHVVHFSDIDKQLSADPPDLNVLEHDRHDPRTVDKLVDGHYFTCDELHAWLAPFTRGQNHFVYLDFDYALSISMIRIWNYNTTRIHSYRGARYVEIALNNSAIFKGEIKRAPGCVTEDVDSCNECILFTMNPSILQLIEKYEKPRGPTAFAGCDSASLAHDAASGSDCSDAVGSAHSIALDVRDVERPRTGNKDRRSAARPNALSVSVNSSDDMRRLGTTTSTGSAHPCAPVTPLPKTMIGRPPGNVALPFAVASRPCTAPMIVCDSVTDKPLSCRTLELVLEANWGDPYEIGIAGLQLLDENYTPVRLSADTATVSAPYDEMRLRHVLSTADAMHESMDPNAMWCAPLESVVSLTGQRDRAIRIAFRHVVTLRALKVWNYNLALEDSYKGAKQVAMYIDGVQLASYSLRKAPGNTMAFDFGQFLHLRHPSSQQHQQQLTSPSRASQVLAIAMPSINAASDNTDSTPSADREPLRDRTSKVFENSASDTGTSVRRSSCSSNAAMKPIAELFQQYQTPLFPTGYIVKFVLLSTWGDTFYLGLNGLELYDEHNCVIALRDDLIDAQPRDINILRDPDAPHDVRTLDKLVDGVNNTYDDRHMWLSPFTPSQPNKLVIFFNEPITLSKVRLWNYSKTPTRGVREFEIFLDDVLIYHGVLKQAPTLSLASLTSASDSDGALFDGRTPLGGSESRRQRQKRFELAEAAADMTQSILFTDDVDVIEAEAANVFVPDDELEESVTFYDNSQVLSLLDASARESVVRPTTSAGHGVVYAGANIVGGVYR